MSTVEKAKNTQTMTGADILVKSLVDHDVEILFAYPGGISPYRPYGRPITYRVFPNPSTPYISVPGPDGMPTLIRDPGAAAQGQPVPEAGTVPR